MVYRPFTLLTSLLTSLVLIIYLLSNFFFISPPFFFLFFLWVGVTWMTLRWNNQLLKHWWLYQQLKKGRVKRNADANKIYFISISVPLYPAILSCWYSHQCFSNWLLETNIFMTPSQPCSINALKAVVQHDGCFWQAFDTTTKISGITPKLIFEISKACQKQPSCWRCCKWQRGSSPDDWAGRSGDSSSRSVGVSSSRTINACRQHWIYILGPVTISNYDRTEIKQAARVWK